MCWTHAQVAYSQSPEGCHWIQLKFLSPPLVVLSGSSLLVSSSLKTVSYAAKCWCNLFVGVCMYVCGNMCMYIIMHLWIVLFVQDMYVIFYEVGAMRKKKPVTTGRGQYHMFKSFMINLIKDATLEKLNSNILRNDRKLFSQIWQMVAP